MRVTGGMARGINLKAPRGERTRPATDFIRQALFSSIGTFIEAIDVADLFAGTGAYGLEALSRGAASVCFVEKDRDAHKHLLSNLDAVLKSMSAQASERSTSVLKADVMNAGIEFGTFDFVIADPPYDFLRMNAARLLDRIAPLVRDGGWLAIEAPGDFTFPGSRQPHKRIGTGAHQPAVYLFK